MGWKRLDIGWTEESRGLKTRVDQVSVDSASGGRLKQGHDGVKELQQLLEGIEHRSDAIDHSQDIDGLEERDQAVRITCIVRVSALFSMPLKLNSLLGLVSTATASAGLGKKLAVGTR